MVETIRTAEELHSLKDDWNKLAESFSHPTLRYEWIAAYAEACSVKSKLYVIVISHKGEITAIAPLMSVRHNAIERLEFIGMSLLFETGGFIYKDEGSLKDLFNAAVALRKPLMLRRIRSEFFEVSKLDVICPQRVMVKMKSDTGTPFIPITMNWETFETNMSLSTRAMLRRKERQAEKLGSVEFMVVSPTLDNVDEYLNEAFHVEASGWKGKKGTAIISNPITHKFFTLYCQKTAELGMLRIFFLRFNGQAAAVRIAVEYANRLWELKIGYDKKWARCSPGVLLTHKTIRYAFERGFNAYEFMGNDESWIKRWTDQVHPYTALHIYPFTMRSVLGLGIDTSRTAVSYLIKKWM